MLSINYFSAAWCGPCKMFSPTMEVVASELNVPINKIDVDQNKDLAESNNVRSVPTLVLMKDGVPVTRHTGIMSKVQLEQFIKAHS